MTHAEEHWRSVHIQEFCMPATFPLGTQSEYYPEQGLELRSEDGGQALIIETNPVAEDCMFVRLQSWEENPSPTTVEAHYKIRGLLGKRCRITVEVLDE